MRSLEEEARDRFSTYSKKKLGKVVPWHKLSQERKNEWVEDTYIITVAIIDELLKEVTQTQQFTPNDSFNSGVLFGVNQENKRLESKLKKIKENLSYDLEKFISP